MQKKTRLTPDEKERIEALIRSGYTKVQIAEMTGRSTGTIQLIRNKLKNTEHFDNYHVGGKTARDIPIPVGIEEKPKKKSSLLVAKKVVRFAGAVTGFEYVVGSNSEDLIFCNNGQEFNVAYKDLEDFITELMEVMVEADKARKLVL